jgi:predicted amidohydrolase
MRLAVGLFKINTQATQNIAVSTRVDYVKAAAEELKRYTDDLEKTFSKPDDLPLRAVFLAPEYSFARSLPQQFGDHTFGQKRQIEEDYVKDTLRPTFEALSKNFRNALIVPGTVAWRKSIVPSTPGKHASIQEAEEYRREKYGDRILSAVDINMDMGNIFGVDTPVFPPQFQKPADMRPTLPTARTKFRAIQTAHYIAKNTAHCYYNGDCIYKYNKIGDFYEVSEDTDDTVIVPNRESKVSGTTVAAGRFKVEGLDVGISICYDQSLSVQSGPTLQIVEPLQKTADPVDIHILLSAHITPNTDLANLKPGGMMMSCSSNSECNAVLVFGGLPLKPHKQLNIKGVAKLDVYQIWA